MSANRSARSRRGKGQSERDQSCVRAGPLTSTAPDSEERRLDRAEKRWPDDHHPCSKRARSETEPENKLRDIAILDAVVALYKGRVAA